MVEYKIELVPKSTKSSKKILRLLNELGNQRWSLISCIDGDIFYGSEFNNNIVYHFKRSMQ